jgi:hypothetical protein
MAAGTVLRIITFVLHFTSAIFLLDLSVRCSKDIKTWTYAESVTDSVGFALVMNATCSDPYSKECFYGFPQAYDTVQHGLSWNVFALLAAFEWLSASFALYYLSDVAGRWWTNAVENTLAICLVWNVIGLLTLMPYNMPLTLMQTGVTALSLLAASAAQITSTLDTVYSSKITQNALPPAGSSDPSAGLFVPKSGRLTTSPRNKPAPHAPIIHTNRVILHYTEYCTSASLLFVAVLILFVPDPVSWAPLFGFVGIMICNITGIGAHYSIIKPMPPDSKSSPWSDLDWTKEGNHFKLFILHSWLSLLSSMFIIVYLAGYSLTSSDVPIWVRFILWNLLVTYTLFGVWATICYSLVDRSRKDDHFDLWMERLDYGLTILSAAAKLPVAYTVFYGLVQEPGVSICKI